MRKEVLLGGFNRRGCILQPDPPSAPLPNEKQHPWMPQHPTWPGYTEETSKGRVQLNSSKKCPLPRP